MSCLVFFVCSRVFFSPFRIAIISFGEERASAFRMFVRFALIWFCPFPLPLGVWEGLRFVIVALPGLFSYLFFFSFFFFFFFYYYAITIVISSSEWTPLSQLIGHVHFQ